MEAQLLELNGTVQNIRFKAEDTGYVVLAVDLEDEFKSFTAVGTMPDAEKGMTVTFLGDWF